MSRDAQALPFPVGGDFQLCSKETVTWLNNNNNQCTVATEWR